MTQQLNQKNQININHVINMIEYEKNMLFIPLAINSIIGIYFSINGDPANSLIFITISLISWITYIKKNTHFISLGIIDIKKNFSIKITARRIALLIFSIFFIATSIIVFDNKNWTCHIPCLNSIYIRNIMHGAAPPLGGFTFFQIFFTHNDFKYWDTRKI